MHACFNTFSTDMWIWSWPFHRSTSLEEERETVNIVCEPYLCCLLLDACLHKKNIMSNHVPGRCIEGSLCLLSPTLWDLHTVCVGFGWLMSYEAGSRMVWVKLLCVCGCVCINNLFLYYLHFVGKFVYCFNLLITIFS